MSLNLLSEVWEVLREHIDLNDRGDATDSLVAYLIENNYEVEDIKDAFRDKDINKSLKDYADEHFQTDEEDDYEDEDYDQDEWN